MKLPKEEYRKVIGYLKRYNYNCVIMLMRTQDIISLQSNSLNGLPSAPYSINDNVYKKVIKLQEDEQLQKAIREYKIVTQALELCSKDSKNIFTNEFQKQKTRWETIQDCYLSERTYERRKRELISRVYEESKKIK